MFMNCVNVWALCTDVCQCMANVYVCERWLCGCVSVCVLLCELCISSNSHIQDIHTFTQSCTFIHSHTFTQTHSQHIQTQCTHLHHLTHYTLKQWTHTHPYTLTQFKQYTHTHTHNAHIHTQCTRNNATIQTKKCTHSNIMHTHKQIDIIYRHTQTHTFTHNAQCIHTIHIHTQYTHTHTLTQCTHTHIETHWNKIHTHTRQAHTNSHTHTHTIHLYTFTYTHTMHNTLKHTQNTLTNTTYTWQTFTHSHTFIHNTPIHTNTLKHNTHLHTIHIHTHYTHTHTNTLKHIFTHSHNNTHVYMHLHTHIVHTFTLNVRKRDQIWSLVCETKTGTNRSLKVWINFSQIFLDFTFCRNVCQCLWQQIHQNNNIRKLKKIDKKWFIHSSTLLSVLGHRQGPTGDQIWSRLRTLIHTH